MRFPQQFSLLKSVVRRHSRRSSRLSSRLSADRTIVGVGMLKLALAFAFSLSFFLAAKPAHADLLLEPYLGYGIGNVDVAPKGSASSKSELSGTAIGARVGLSLPVVFFAADYRILNGKLKPKEGTAHDGDGDETQFGVVVGANLPILRPYAGYIFMNDLKATSGGSETTYRGAATKVGVGFTGLPFVAINAEYVMSNYTKIKNSNGEFSLGDANISDVKSNVFLFSVSAPFEL